MVGRDYMLDLTSVSVMLNDVTVVDRLLLPYPPPS